MRKIMITGVVLLLGLTAMAQPREGAGKDMREREGVRAREGGREGGRVREDDGRRPGAPAMRRERPAGPRGDGEDETALLLRLLRNPAFAERLKLSPDEQGQLIEEVRGMQQRIGELQGELQALALRQANLMAGPAPDESAVLESVEALGQVRTEIAKLRMRQLLAMRRRLSPEQLQQMRRFMQQQRGQERRREDPRNGT